MSARILSSLSDENQDLHKQYGCMHGIFQLFDHHYFITEKRIGSSSSSSNSKRLLPIPGAELGTESKSATGNVMEKNVEIVKDEPCISVESPRNSSSSSSRQATLSLPKHVKIQEARPPLISQSNYLDHPTQAPKKQNSSSLYSNHQANDLQNAVKNSIHKDSSGLSVTTAVKEEGRSHAMKHIDSPRPLQLSKSSYSRITGFDGSARALTRIPESPRSSMELKDTLPALARKEDLPRFSLDGRETPEGYKSTAKFKDMPRLSLDSRETSLRSSVSESRSNYILRDFRRDNINQIKGANEEPGSNKRPSNLVVKLMGLEDFPDSNLGSEDHIYRPYLSLDPDFESSSIKKSNKTKESQSLPQKEAQKDPASPSLRNDSSLMKPSSTSRFPIEQAPWRQLNGSHHTPKTAQKSSRVCTEAKITSSVYGEMEKRISKLEFKKSGKDLRALKQILEAMQKTRKMSEDQEAEQSELEPETRRCSSSSSLCNQISKASNCRSTRSSNATQAKDPSSPKKIDSSMAIRKPPSAMYNSKISSFTEITTAETSHLLKFQNRSTAYVREDLVVKVGSRDEPPRCSTFKDPRQCRSLTYKKSINNALKPVQTSKAPQLLKDENHTAFGRSSAAVSPRFQANQHGAHNRSPAASPSIETGKARKKSSQKPKESDKSTRKLRPTCTNQQGSKSKSSSYTDIRNFPHIEDSASLQSDSDSSTSQIENTVTSAETPIGIISKQHIYSKERVLQNIAARFFEDKLLAELTGAEQPSPVSVLDATFCVEDLPSPVKKISITFQDFETPDSDDAELQLDSLDLSIGIARSSHHDELSKREPVHLKHLTPSTRSPTVTPNAASWDLQGSLNRNSNSHYDYIAKILSASGLLKNMGPFLTATQPQLSGQLINPDLFHVLEQAEQNIGKNHNGKTATSKCDQKIHRRMLFDTVNEIIVHKLASKGPCMLGKRIKTEHELLREISLEMDSLQGKSDCCFSDPDGLGSILSADMKRQPNDWADNQSEIPALVLDIEQRIFKDLVTEVLNGENLCLHYKPRKQHKLSVC